MCVTKKHTLSNSVQDYVNYLIVFLSDWLSFHSIHSYIYFFNLERGLLNFVVLILYSASIKVIES